MNSFNRMQLFGFYFFKSIIIFLGFVYADQNFRKPFEEFSSADFIRISLLVIIIGAVLNFSSGSLKEFESISIKIRFCMASAAGLTAILSAGYLLSVYF